MKQFGIWTLALVFVSSTSLVSCTSKDQLKKTLEENPDILFNVIEKHPAQFFEVLQKASQEAQVKGREQAEQQERAAMEEEFKNPKQAAIDEKRVIFGKKNAPITIVEYSDFECPYCSRGYQVIKQVMKAYPDQVRVLYKHLPLDFHAMAEPAARMYEAIALQNHGKAEKFHDLIFENQGGLKQGKEKFLEDMAKRAGADVARAKKDMNSDAISEIVMADMNEAQSFGFSGTPGFLVNGVSVRGAYPFEHLKSIIDRHLAN